MNPYVFQLQTIYWISPTGPPLQLKKNELFVWKKITTFNNELQGFLKYNCFHEMMLNPVNIKIHNLLYYFFVL